MTARDTPVSGTSDQARNRKPAASGTFTTWCDRCAWTTIALAACGLLVRFSIRDRLPGFDLVYYGTPLPVVAVLLGFAGLFWLLGRRRARFLACVISGSALAAAWLATSHVRSPCDPDPDGTPVLFWNVARGWAGLEAVAAAVGESGAEIVALVEARTPGGFSAAVYREALPDYEVHDLGDGLMVLTRWKVVWSRYRRFGRISRASVVRLEQGDREVDLVLFDVEADPLSPRRALLERAAEIAAGDPGVPRILAGDFNTPLDSVWFVGFRVSFDHAFEVAGTGFFPTWPRQLPLFAIDHVWVSRDISVTCARTEFRRLSDHAMIAVDVAIPARDAGAPTSDRPTAPERSLDS